MGVLLLFVDGLGLGHEDPEKNPLAVAETRWFRLFGTGWERPVEGPPGLCVPTDATLGLPGLPQSATGQATLLTGINAARMLGRHAHSFCTPTLTALVAEASLFRTLTGEGRRVTFANAFTPRFFAGRRRFLPVITVAALRAGLRLRTLQDLAESEAVYQDLTREKLVEQGYDLPLISPEEAGAHLARLAAGHDFTLFEFFQTDLCGHSQERERAVEVVTHLDRFLTSLLSQVDLEETLVLLTSDHGNLEDLTSRRHTTNPVPTLLWGRGREEVARRIRGLMDIAPAVRDWLREPAPVGDREREVCCATV